MSKENSANNNADVQEFPPNFFELQKLNCNIAEAYLYLWQTFFTQDTWKAKLAFDSECQLFRDLGKEKQEQVSTSIVEELNDRNGYYLAYTFPDSLSAFYWWTSGESVRVIEEESPDKSRAEVVDEILQSVRAGLKEKTKQFEEFLGSDNFKNAFTIKVDWKTGEYQIRDLPLDAGELMSKWQGWFGVGESDGGV